MRVLSVFLVMFSTGLEGSVSVANTPDPIIERFAFRDEQKIPQNGGIASAPHLQRFYYNGNKFKVSWPDNSDVYYGMINQIGYETDAVPNLTNYGIGQQIRGCVYDSYVDPATNEIKRDVGYQTIDLYGETVRFHLREFVNQTHNGDPLDHGPRSDNSTIPAGWQRHREYAWNRDTRAHETETQRVVYNHGVPPNPRLYLDSRLPLATYSSQSQRATNVSLAFRTCLYPAESVPRTVAKNHLRFAQPVACFDWQFSYEFNHRTGRFDERTELDPICQQELPPIAQVPPSAHDTLSTEEHWQRIGMSFSGVRSSLLNNRFCHQGLPQFLGCLYAANNTLWDQPDPTYLRLRPGSHQPPYQTEITSVPHAARIQLAENSAASQIAAYAFRRQAMFAWDDVVRRHFTGTALPAGNILVDFDRLFADLEQTAVTSEQNGTLAANAVDSILAFLFDDFSRIVPATQFFAQVGSTGEQFAGLGVALSSRQSDGMLRIDRILPTGPVGRQTSLRFNDLITHIYGERNGTTAWVPTTETSLTEEKALLRGAPGSTVRLRIDRLTEPVTVTRETLVAQSVEAFTVDSTSRSRREKIGVIKVKTFATDHICEQATESLRQLEREGVRGLIIDLRDNVGGITDEANCLLSLFLPPSTNTFEMRPISSEEPREQFRTSATATPTQLPVTVLINSVSASASEIFAGVIADYNRAWLVGEQSAGKGCYQKVDETGGEAAALTGQMGLVFFVTGGRYFLPRGESNHLTGIYPHLEVFPKPDTSATEQVRVRVIDTSMNPGRFEIAPISRELSSGLASCVRQRENRSGGARSDFGRREVLYSHDYQLLKARDVMTCEIQSHLQSDNARPR